MLNNDPDAVSTGTANGPERFGANNPADLVNRRPQLMEWAIGKGYDLYRPGTGKLLVPGETIAWDTHIHAVGEEITVGTELAIWFYPQGRGAEEAQLPDRLHRHRPHQDARHPAELDGDDRGLHGAQGEHADRELPAALPSARQGHAGRSDSAERRQGSHQLRWQLQLQLDDQLHLRRRRGAAAARRERSSTSPLGTTTPRPTRTTPIRISGSATATAPSTRWRMPG